MSLPVVWSQMPLGSWLRLLRENRFQVDPAMRGRAARLTASSALASALGAVQRLVYDGAVTRTPVESPLFIVGHWRSGTTWLFDLLAQDERFAYPTQLTTLFAQHLLLTRPLLERWFRDHPVERRGVDAVPMGPGTPREDEFGLCALGLPSPYLEFAFPNRRPPARAALLLGQLPAAEQREWREGFLRYLQTLTYAHRKPLLLKSPTHTARVGSIVQLLPDARFIHIVRNPYDVFPSMRKMMKAAQAGMGLQRPRYEGLDEHILDIYATVMGQFEADRDRVPAGRLHEIRYEELAADPLGQLERLYAGLDLPGFGAARPRIEAYLQRVAPSAPPPPVPLEPALRARLEERWGPFLERYGYAAST